MIDLGFYRMDCVPGMKLFPDKHFNLAIVDPPYGLNVLNGGGRIDEHGNGNAKWAFRKRKTWDTVRPDENYFVELFRVSENQIIWGGNHFTEFLPPKQGWIVWDKMNDEMSVSSAELAFTSFDQKIMTFRMRISAERGFLAYLGDIHPNQKPVKLYRWLLHNYANPNDLILDTHVGSASSLIACEQMEFKYVGFEIDDEYYADASRRLKKHQDIQKQNSFAF